MDAELNTIIIYARNMNKTADFYRKYFGFKTTGEALESLIELTSEGRGFTILVHQAAKSIKLGQAGVKLVFSVQDIEGLKRECAELGLVFGAIHQANGYSFSNAKDPDKNTVSISSRAYRKIA